MGIRLPLKGNMCLGSPWQMGPPNIGLQAAKGGLGVSLGSID